MKQFKRTLLCLLLAISLILPAEISGIAFSNTAYAAQTINLPKYTGSPYLVLNGNEPNFTNEQKADTNAFEYYSPLDSLGRCGTAFANICKELMPTEARGDISMIHPSGWQKGFDWQRCHLIGFQLAGENANPLNLITGTRYFNVTGMLPFENMVDDYVDETDNHVLYRVTPFFEGNNLVASGVEMEAWSVEDNGDGLCFDVYVFNVFPGKTIDYETGMVYDTTQPILKPSTITITDKTLTYNGSIRKVGAAVVTGSTGSVSYTYYTDSACTKKTSPSLSGSTYTGSAPRYAGTYYCIANLAADDLYEGAQSSPAKLTVKKASSTITLANRSVTYSGKAKSISAAVVTGSAGAVTYTYYTDEACKNKTAEASGAETIGAAPVNAGIYYVKAKVASDKNYYSKTSEAARLTIKKASQTITVATSSKTYNQESLALASKSFSMGAKAQGSLSYEKLSGSSRLSVTAGGSIKTLKATTKGTKTITVRITAAETDNYKKTYLDQTFTVKVLAPPAGLSDCRYVLNKESMKYHKPTCRYAKTIKAEAVGYTNLTASELAKLGYTACKTCN